MDTSSTRVASWEDRRCDWNGKKHLMPFSLRWDSALRIENCCKHPVMSLNSHTVPPTPSYESRRAIAATETLINQTIFRVWKKTNNNNLHFWFWPLRKAFRLWWRTLDLTSCTSTLYHHFDSSWHVPLTKVEQSGVWMRMLFMCPVICSASATSITSDMLMLACGIVSGCVSGERRIELITTYQIRWFPFHYRLGGLDSVIWSS